MILQTKHKTSWVKHTEYHKILENETSNLYPLHTESEMKTSCQTYNKET